jgi:hypothetical protein
MEQVFETGNDSLFSFGEQCHFEQADGADSDPPSIPDGFIEDAGLLP